MSIDIPLVIDWHYIDTQLVSHWMSIGITLTVKYFNWQQIGIQLAMDWHRLYWIGIPYLPADTSQKVRPQTWRLAVRLSWVWLAPDWVLISGHWRIIAAFALHWLNWHEFQFRTFELHWRWIGIITNPWPILVGFDWLGCIGLEKSGALYIWESQGGRMCVCWNWHWWNVSVSTRGIWPTTYNCISKQLFQAKGMRSE